MAGLSWTRVHDNDITTGGTVPSQRHHSSFTRVSQSTAVLYGYDECWLLDLSNADRLKGQPSSSSSMWSRIPTPFWRENHAAVFEPESRRLWIIGGIDSRGPTSDVLEMTNALLPLRDLALYHAARNFRAGDPRLFQGKFPRKLTNEIVAWRTNINAAAAAARRVEGRKEIYSGSSWFDMVD